MPEHRARWSPAQDNPPTPSYWLAWLATIASAATIIAGLMYGYGWLILAQFYSEFGVNPEEVGVTFAFVTVRIAIIMGALSVVVALTILALRLLGRIKIVGPSASEERATARFDVIFFERFAGAAWGGSFLASCIIIVIFDAFGIVLIDERDAGLLALLAVGTASAPLWMWVILLAWLALSGWTVGRVISLQKMMNVLTIVLWFGIAGMLSFAAWWLPREMADIVQRGEDLASARFISYISYVGLRVDSVEVTAAGSDTISPSLDSGRCVKLLGSAGGVTILYDPQQQLLVRAPTERLILEKPCR
ncbi:MAG: hypothetical protein ACRDTG_03090 [Pseudonocardiaceae bacterium]